MEGLPRQRGPPRRGHVCLGEPKDRLWEILVHLGEVVACLGEGRLRLGKPVTV